MKKILTGFCILAFACALGAGCASVPVPSGEKGILEDVLNALPEVTDPVTGKQVKFVFDRNVWYQQVDGKNLLAGTFESGENNTFILSQTHVYSSEQLPATGEDTGWINMTGPEILITYNPGPPPSLTAAAAPERTASGTESPGAETPAVAAAPPSGDPAEEKEESLPLDVLIIKAPASPGTRTLEPPDAERWGLRAGIDIGSIEHSDTNVRSFVIIPNAVYKHSIDDFDLSAAMDIFFDLRGPDPDYEAIRQRQEGIILKDKVNAYSLYAEEEAAYNLHISRYKDVPATVTFFLNLQNNIVFAPDLWELKKDSQRFMDYGELNKIDGSIAPAIQYRHQFFFGDLYTKYGFPFKYASLSEEGYGIPIQYTAIVHERTQTKNGVGMEALLGYSDGFDLGLCTELSFDFIFSPDTEYAATELFLGWTKNAFYAGTAITAGKKFKSWTIDLEANYSIDPVTFKIAWTWDHLGRDPDTGDKLDPVFFPRMGFAWNL